MPLLRAKTMPFKITSKNPVHQQQAALALSVMQADAMSAPIYAGMCTCPTSVKHNVIILSPKDTDHCAFCHSEVSLTRLLGRKEIAAWRQTVLN